MVKPCGRRCRRGHASESRAQAGLLVGPAGHVVVAVAVRCPLGPGGVRVLKRHKTRAAVGAAAGAWTGGQLHPGTCANMLIIMVRAASTSWASSAPSAAARFCCQGARRRRNSSSCSGGCCTLGSVARVAPPPTAAAAKAPLAAAREGPTRQRWAHRHRSLWWH